MRKEDIIFLLAASLCFLIAYFFPEIGKKGSTLHPENTISALAGIIFFINGIEIRKDHLREKPYLKDCSIVQVFSFFVLAIAAYFLHQNIFYRWNPSEVYFAGIMLLASLPTTVASASTFTKIAEGDQTFALINSLIGNTLGVFLVPLIVNYFLPFRDFANAPISALFINLCLIAIAPFTLGFVLQKFVHPNIKWLKLIQRILLLLIVFFSLSESFYQININYELKNISLFLLSIETLILYLLFFLISLFMGIYFNFSRERKIASLYILTQKTAVLGIPLAESLGLIQKEQSLFLMPLLFYTLIQWFGSSIALIFLKRII